MKFCTEVQYKMQPINCQHREQYISKKESSNLIEKIYISGLELQRWSLEFVIFFSKVPGTYLVFRSEVWLIPLGIQILFRVMNFQNIFPTMKRRNRFRNILNIKLLFLRNGYVYHKWLFIFETNSTQKIYSVLKNNTKSGVENLRINY
jgi:hypothetical protein